MADLPWRLHSRVSTESDLHASFRYVFPIVECIGRAKLGGDCGLAQQIGRWMATRPVVAAAACELVCAVPQHWRRAIVRGYNQALEIARPIASVCGRPLWTDVLQRSAGMPQRGLGRTTRLRNVAGLMRADARVAGRRVLVIDDVTTTGATFREAARALRAAGAAHVVCWAAAAVD
jgi:predicted amidophosphoribosyltransferase